jgi:formate hydrogenlyase subunit 6/NADH:ubiquinone oxidoreductase subunit I
MGTWTYIKGVLIATWTGIRHLFKPRITLRYPEQKLDLEGPGYKYDAKKGVGLAGFKGRHLLYFEKCTGCQLCAIACDGVAVAIDMQKVTKGKPQNKKDIWPAVDYGRCVFCGLCVAPETEVMTNPGIKAISEIKVGDRVLTHTGQYRPVTKVWEMIYTGPLYEIKVLGKPLPLVCTADHKVLAVRRQISTRLDGRLLRNFEPVEMVFPRDLKVGDYLLTPIPKRIDDLKYVEIEIESHHEIKKLILKIDPDLFRLIGYYLSEGSTNLESRATNFSFGSDEDDLISDASQLLQRYFAKDPRVDMLRQHVANVRLGSKLAMKFFVQFGRGAENKFLPDWVLFASRDKQVQLIKGIFLGDGCVDNQPRQKYLNITTVSKLLANQIQLVLTRLGIVSTISVETQQSRLPAYRINVFGESANELARMMDFHFDYVPTKSVAKFHINSEFVFSPIERIGSKSVVDRMVMDITVENDHTFVGQGIAQHNCVDACPFDALDMTNDYELSAYDKMGLKYTPDMLAVPPKLEGKKYKVKFDTEKGEVRYG